MVDLILIVARAKGNATRLWQQRGRGCVLHDWYSAAVLVWWNATDSCTVLSLVVVTAPKETALSSGAVYYSLGVVGGGGSFFYRIPVYIFTTGTTGTTLFTVRARCNGGRPKEARGERDTGRWGLFRSSDAHTPHIVEGVVVYRIPIYAMAALPDSFVDGALGALLSRSNLCRFARWTERHSLGLVITGLKRVERQA